MLQKVCFNTGTSTQILNSQSLVTTLGNRVLVAFSGNVRKQNQPPSHKGGPIEAECCRNHRRPWDVLWNYSFSRPLGMHKKKKWEKRINSIATANMWGPVPISAHKKVLKFFGHISYAYIFFLRLLLFQYSELTGLKLRKCVVLKWKATSTALPSIWSQSLSYTKLLSDHLSHVYTLCFVLVL